MANRGWHITNNHLFHAGAGEGCFSCRVGVFVLTLLTYSIFQVLLAASVLVKFLYGVLTMT
jgi:hypothetical protein